MLLSASEGFAGTFTIITFSAESFKCVQVHDSDLYNGTNLRMLLLSGYTPGVCAHLLLLDNSSHEVMRYSMGWPHERGENNILEP